MNILQQNLSGFIILLVLGLRHGLDPDHITVIDGYTYRLHEKKKFVVALGRLFIRDWARGDGGSYCAVIKYLKKQF